MEQKSQEVSTKVRGLQEGGVTQTIHLRSIHYNGLKYMVNAFPPQDLHNPMVIDAYNAIWQQVASDSDKVQYIDTKFLVAPSWDSVADLESSSSAGLYAGVEVLGGIRLEGGTNALRSRRQV